MGIRNALESVKKKYYLERELRRKNKSYLKRFRRYAFSGSKCRDERQYEAVITRWYHTIEKGLSYENYRAGFGKANVEQLLSAMENYAKDGYDTDQFFYRTALSTLHAYLEKNKACGVENQALEKRIGMLNAVPNESGGAFRFVPLPMEQVQSLNYGEFVKNRHSMRHFSSEPVEMERIERAVKLAQYTPSACNRQGWRIRILTDKKTIRNVLANQNGNQGFGDEFDKLLLITSDLRCANLDREVFQAFIDGGMYAQSVLNALHFEHIASVPLSASLSMGQERNVREILKLEEAEMPILFVGIGNYPRECQTTKSERRPAEMIVL